MSRIPLIVPIDHAESIKAELDVCHAHYARRIQLAEPSVATLILDVFSSPKDISPWGAMAAAFVSWMAKEAGRRIRIKRSVDQFEIELKGLNEPEIAKALEKAISIRIEAKAEQNNDH